MTSSSKLELGLGSFRDQCVQLEDQCEARRSCDFEPFCLSHQGITSCASCCSVLDWGACFNQLGFVWLFKWGLDHRHYEVWLCFIQSIISFSGDFFLKHISVQTDLEWKSYWAVVLPVNLISFTADVMPHVLILVSLINNASTGRPLTTSLHITSVHQALKNPTTASKNHCMEPVSWSWLNILDSTSFTWDIYFHPSRMELSRLSKYLSRSALLLQLIMQHLRCTVQNPLLGGGN